MAWNDFSRNRRFLPERRLRLLVCQMLPPAMTEHGGKNPEMDSRRIGPIQLENLDGV
jgi:hypothetical protein